MKTYTFCSILIINFITFVFPSCLNAEIITTRADTWCPYNCDPKSDSPGLFIELMQIAFAKDGSTINYETMPWTQALADVRSGLFNSALGVTGFDVVGMQHSVKPQILSTTCAYALDSSKKIINHASDLKKFKSIGVIKDYSYGAITDKVLFDIKDRVSFMGTEDALLVNIRRLLDRKIEILIEDINVMSYQINKRKIKNIKKIGCTEELVPLWIGFTSSNPKSKKWIEMLELTEKELEKSGKMTEIYAHYGIKH